MKKTSSPTLVLTLAAFLGLVDYGFGQGQVDFRSTAAANTQISTNIDGLIGKIDGPVGTWQFALFVANSTNVTTVNGISNTMNNGFVTPWTDPNWTSTGIYATNTGTPGRILGVTDSAGFVTVPGTTVGSYYNFVIVGWDTATGGKTLSSLIAAYYSGALHWYGTSGIAKGVLLGDNGVTQFNQGLLGINANQTPGWQFVIPEPTTLSLAGLGAVALLISRRQKFLP